jgi:hypothetical protein
MTTHVLIVVGLACAAYACYRLLRANWNVYRQNDEPLMNYVPDMLLACFGLVATCYVIRWVGLLWGLR